MTFERGNLKRLGGYVPGEQPHRAKAKLNTNENPFPPCDAVLRVLAGIDGEMLRRYPDPTAQAFRAEAARLHGLNPDNIIATNGGDELLRLALTTFLPPGSPLGWRNRVTRSIRSWRRFTTVRYVPCPWKTTGPHQ
jgi:histidinol-phosphate aminotransferase